MTATATATAATAANALIIADLAAARDYMQHLINNGALLAIRELQECRINQIKSQLMANA